MTKIVKEYIERKIREGAQPKLDALKKNRMDIRAATPGREDIDKAVYSSPEYKSLEAFIRTWAKNHQATVVSAGCQPGRLLSTSFIMKFGRVGAAEQAVHDFEAKVDNAVRDALVELELTKGKKDVDAAITRAVASLSKGK